MCFKFVQLYCVSVQRGAHKVTNIVCMSCDINANVYSITKRIQSYNTYHEKTHPLLLLRTKHHKPQRIRVW